MITIKKVLAAEEGSCNGCYLDRENRPKYVFNITIPHGPSQSTSIRLCKSHLNELACAAADELDPLPTPRKKKHPIVF